MEVKAILLDMNGVMFDAQNASEAQSQNSKTILKKGVVELIEYAKKNDLKLAVCTEDTKEKCEALFKICALSASQFDLVLSHSEIDVSNTNASFYQTALEKLNTKFEKLNLKTEECLVLVSTYTAAQTAKEAKLQVAYIKDLEKTNVEKDKKYLDYKFYNLLEVTRLLDFLKIECSKVVCINNDYNTFLRVYHKNMKLVEKYNKTPFAKTAKREKILKNLLAEVGANPMIVSPFYCDEGFDIRIGNSFFSNFGFVILSGGEVRIGNNCRFGPYSGIYNIGHDFDPEKRKNNTIYAQKTYVGNNVWFGASAKIVGGVKIGDNSIIGAGTVVTHDVKPNAIYAGNPAKFIKFIL
mgnify:CR=1 FL=1